MGELQRLRHELDEICDEGSTQIGAASRQVQAIHKGHEDALKEIERLNADRRKQMEREAKLEAEHAAVLEQKAALSKIVEDLHQSCIDGGLSGLTEAGRMSVEGIFAQGPLT